MSQAINVRETSEDALWRFFGAATTTEAFCKNWLALQCSRIDGVTGGVVLLVDPEDVNRFLPGAHWPDEQANLIHLAEVAKRAVAEGRGLILKRQAREEGPDGYDVAYPIQVGGSLHGVVALQVEPRPEPALREVMRKLQWGSAWMEVLFHRGRTSRDLAPQQRLQTVVDLLASSTSHDSFRGSAVSLATALATQFTCDRVSLGFLRNGSIRVEAMSHSAHFAKNANLMRAIAAAMDEAVDQGASIVFPTPAGRETLIVRSHEELGRQFGNGNICTFPLTHGNEIVGALTLERPVDLPFDRATLDICESTAGLSGSLLELYRREDRWLPRKALDSTVLQLGRLIGPRYVGRKLAAATLAAVVLFLMFAEGVYRVTADTVVEPAQRQALVASFSGYVSTAPVRAGDVVSEGEILATLDDRDLRLEHDRWQSQREQSERQYYGALGSGLAPEIGIFKAQMAQAGAQVELLEAQIERTAITAPFDGVVVTGDLSQAIGSPVERGQVLFELAPLDAYRVVIQVDERYIADVVEGQSGSLVLSGFTEDPVRFEVSRLTPVSTAAEGLNFFRVEAVLDRVPENLRPGMEGVAKIEVEDRLLMWIWTHDLLDWLRLKTWTLLP